MIRKAIAPGLLALCLLSTPAWAGSEVYFLFGAGTRSLGDETQALADATADELASQPLLGTDWSAENLGRAGFDGGVGFAYTRGDLLGLCLELHGATRGDKWRLTEPDSAFTIEQSLALNYIEVPLLLRVAPQISSGVRADLLVGPVLGFRIHSKTNSTIEVAVPPNASDELLALRYEQQNEAASALRAADVADYAKDTYVGGAIGVGLRIRTTQTTALLVQARYQMSFGNVLEDAAGYDLKPQDFTFSIGGAFDL